MTENYFLSSASLVHVGSYNLCYRAACCNIVVVHKFRVLQLHTNSAVGSLFNHVKIWAPYLLCPLN